MTAASHQAYPPDGRRYQLLAPASLGALRILRLGEVELELDGHQLRLGGTPVHLPHREFQVLELLLSNAGRVVTRRELLDHIWGPGHPDIHKTIEVHINRLRRRFRTENRPDHIRTVRGVGYIFDIFDIFDIPDTTGPTG